MEYFLIVLRKIKKLPDEFYNFWNTEKKSLIEEINSEDIINVINDIEEMINYNIKLVWLHESVIPDTIIQFMNQQEYKICDIKYIKSNYKVMLNEDSDIQNLFESI